MKLFIVVTLLTLTTFAGDIKSSAEEFIRSSFDYEVQLNFEKYTIPKETKTAIEKSCKQRFFKESIYIWRIKRGSKLKGLAILDNVYGKSLPITFIAVFDLNGKIISSKVVKYREPYGGAVRESGWSDQFIGMSGADEFKVGGEIQSISGATISVQSVTSGINKLALLANYILGKE